MDDLSLPPVAKSIYQFCKKCDADRYHTVLAHTTSLSAKIQCEVCGAKSTFKVGEPKKGRKKATTRKKRISAEEAHKQAYDEIHQKIGTGDMKKYNMKDKFESDTAIDHPKFGVGFILSVAGDKMSVCFEDSERMLVHNRS